MTVYLVGAGPGDPGLITARGLELVRACDVLVHDRLVAPELVAEAPPEALRISRECLSQDEINRLLVSYGKEGFLVVRLKGGDPFVFGRGGEEALSLAQAEVPFAVVPGVSALSAVPASAGIPITHRGLASQVTLVTGQACNGADGLDHAALARTPGTLAVFMGLARLGEIAEALIAHGRAAETPAAVIASGTLPEQCVVIAPLGEIADAADGIDPPALVVIGDVVSLADRLASIPEAALLPTGP